MSAVYTPPDYRKLWEDESERTRALTVERDKLKLTLRDQFAMAALTGMTASSYWSENLTGNDRDSLPVAQAAYVMADAMLEARK